MNDEVSSIRDCKTYHTQLHLEDSEFEASVEKFIDEEKPDPLILQQIQSLSITWENSAIDTHIQSSTTSAEHDNHINGTLKIVGEYITMKLRTKCTWTGSDSLNKMHFELQTSFTMTPKPLWKRLRKGKAEESMQTNSKIEDRIRSKLVKKIKSDAVISKHLDTEQSLLCDAYVQFQQCGTNQSNLEELEERVYVSEDTLAAIHQSLFPQSDSPIFVMEFLLNMPYLSTTDLKSSLSSSLENRRKKLAQRVMLRLLEECMIDECTKEEENDLISDLCISHECDEDDTMHRNQRLKQSRE